MGEIKCFHSNILNLNSYLVLCFTILDINSIPSLYSITLLEIHLFSPSTFCRAYHKDFLAANLYWLHKYFIYLCKHFMLLVESYSIHVTYCTSFSHLIRHICSSLLLKIFSLTFDWISHFSIYFCYFLMSSEYLLKSLFILLLYLLKHRFFCHRHFSSFSSFSFSFKSNWFIIFSSAAYFP